MAYRKYYKKRRYYKKYNRDDSFKIDDDTAFRIIGLIIIFGIVYKLYSWFLTLDSGVKSWLILVVLFIIGLFLYVKFFKKDNLSEDQKAEYIHENMKKSAIIEEGYTNKSVNNVTTNEVVEENKCFVDVKDDEYPNISMSNDYDIMQRLRELYPNYFEEFIQMLFEFTGYKILKKPSYKGLKAQPDGGKDLIVSKDGIKTVIQVKKDFAHQTGSAVIREFNGCNEKCDKKIFITSSIFSKDAIKTAKEDNIVCLDYSLLLKWISSLLEEYGNEMQDYLNNKLHIDTKFKYHPKTCKRCYAPMQKGKWKWKGTYLCMNYYNKDSVCYHKK